MLYLRWEKGSTLRHLQKEFNRGNNQSIHYHWEVVTLKYLLHHNLKITEQIVKKKNLLFFSGKFSLFVNLFQC